jgi:putative ATPase
MSTPLATVLRPSTLEDIIGQKHLLREEAPFRKTIEAGIARSILLWGPPGSGKTTLAQIMATRTNRPLIQLSAVTDGIGELRKCIENAKTLFQKDGSGYLLFVDEIHRWNKTQQDALLPHVESGIITLIGATTENPSFSVNPALRSRCWILSLDPLTNTELCEVLQRGCQHLGVSVPESIITNIASHSSGDARRALSILERIAPVLIESQPTEEMLTQILGDRDLLHDATGDAHYSVVSAFIKSMRGSNPDAALYWLSRLLSAGEDPMFIARRMVIFASEDIGNADVRALPLATSAMQATHMIGMPEARIILGQCCTFLATAPKSNAAYNAINRAMEHVRKTGSVPVPKNIADPPKGYKYPHDYPNAFVQQEYWPKSIQQQFYIPTNFGDEKVISQRLDWWNRRKSGT